MQDRADRLTDKVEQRALDSCRELYAEALKRATRKCAHTLKQLKELDEKKPPSNCDTPEKQDKWREEQRRRILRNSGIEDTVAKEVAAAGKSAAAAIRNAMDEIDRINRVVEDIGN